VVGSSGVVIGFYRSFCHWSVAKSQVDDRFAIVALARPVVGGLAIISDLQSIFVNHFYPEGSIPLPSASQIP